MQLLNLQIFDHRGSWDSFVATNAEPKIFKNGSNVIKPCALT